jgi:hypothetical protein
LYSLPSVLLNNASPFGLTVFTARHLNPATESISVSIPTGRSYRPLPQVRHGKLPAGSDRSSRISAVRASIPYAETRCGYAFQFMAATSSIAAVFSRGRLSFDHTVTLPGTAVFTDTHSFPCAFHPKRLTRQWSERPPAARSHFGERVRLRSEPRSLSVAVAHFVLVRW